MTWADASLSSVFPVFSLCLVVWWRTAHILPTLFSFGLMKSWNHFLLGLNFYSDKINCFFFFFAQRWKNKYYLRHPILYHRLTGLMCEPCHKDFTMWQSVLCKCHRINRLFILKRDFHALWIKHCSRGFSWSIKLFLPVIQLRKKREGIIIIVIVVFAF